MITALVIFVGLFLLGCGLWIAGEAFVDSEALCGLGFVAMFVGGIGALVTMVVFLVVKVNQ
jgi:hypothetical protein